jgi:hypothetical protein
VQQVFSVMEQVEGFLPLVFLGAEHGELSLAEV